MGRHDDLPRSSFSADAMNVPRNNSNNNLNRASSYCASHYLALNTDSDLRSTAVFSLSSSISYASPSVSSPSPSLAAMVSSVDLFGRFSAIVKRNTVNGTLAVPGDEEKRRHTSGHSPTSRTVAIPTPASAAGRFRISGSERKSSFPSLPPASSSLSSSVQTFRRKELDPRERQRRQQLEQMEFGNLHQVFACGQTLPRDDNQLVDETNERVVCSPLRLEPKQVQLLLHDEPQQRELSDSDEEAEAEASTSPGELNRYLSQSSKQTGALTSRVRIYQSRAGSSSSATAAAEPQHDQDPTEMEMEMDDGSQEERTSMSQRSDFRTQATTETETEQVPLDEDYDYERDHDSFLDAVCHLHLHDPIEQQEEEDQQDQRKQKDLLTTSVRHLVLHIKNDSEQFHQRHHPYRTTPRPVVVSRATSVPPASRKLLVRRRGNSCPTSIAQLDAKSPISHAEVTDPVGGSTITPGSRSPSPTASSAALMAMAMATPPLHPPPHPQPARRSAFARLVGSRPSRIFESLGFHSTRRTRKSSAPTTSYLLTDDQCEVVEGARWKIVELAFRFGGKHRFYLVQAVNMFFPLVKYGRHGGPHATRLHCNRCGTIQWQHKRGGLSEPMDLAQVVDIYEGRLSVVFHRHNHTSHGGGSGSGTSGGFNDVDSRSFSLVFAKRTLDLETQSTDHRDWLLSALRTLISYAKKQREVEKRALMEEEARQLVEQHAKKKNTSSAAITA